MPHEAPDHLVVGHLNKPHGTRGELYVWPLTDHGATVFVAGARLTMGDEHGHVSTIPHRVLEVESSRAFRRGYLVKFVGVDDRTAAEAFRDRYVLRPISELPEREAGEVFYHELLGMAVVTSDGERVGVVREVYELTPHHMLDVEREGQADRLLVPLADALVDVIDVNERRVVISPPPGFLDL